MFSYSTLHKDVQTNGYNNNSQLSYFDLAPKLKKNNKLQTYILQDWRLQIKLLFSYQMEVSCFLKKWSMYTFATDLVW